MEPVCRLRTVRAGLFRRRYDSGERTLRERYFGAGHHLTALPWPVEPPVPVAKEA
jgi:hypothetical protein